jgi:hypothetical protein
MVIRYGFDPEVTPNKSGRSRFAMWWRFCLEKPNGPEWEDFMGTIPFRFNIEGPADIIPYSIKDLIEVIA